ncbi:branched-chain amino acid ABC transporter permease [Rhodococcus qingshengii]|uniref:branched-chain amino acid ABC transporter permease n=1 Tax=Rhodococcus qingshengii TaxID=334542 RepID=UPI00237C73A9|nr:branched-chain amino acid ABC transporter permease [Rhodococcus qingshengii]WCT05751.1 branched-chain amino acid ABC transporter permease [Rhodococcus qingshengii]
MSESRRNRIRIQALCLGALLMLLLPFLLDDFWLQLGLFAMGYAVGAIGLTILIGTAGQLSLAHAFFVAFGAYSYCFLTAPASSTAGGLAGLGLSPIVGLVVGILLAGVAGALFAPVASRLRGIYLGLASLALVFIGQYLLLNLTSITGGHGGRIVEPFAIAGFSFSDFDPTGLQIAGVAFGGLHRNWYLFLGLLALAAVIGIRITGSRSGRAMMMVRDSEPAAGALGIDVPRVKIVAFTISSMYAGGCGVMLALAFGSIVPDSFSLAMSVSFLVMVVVGGAGRISGAVVGAAFVSMLPLVLTRYSGSIPFLAEAGGSGFGASQLSQTIFGLAVIAALLMRHRRSNTRPRSTVRTEADSNTSTTPQGRLSS